MLMTEAVKLNVLYHFDILKYDFHSYMKYYTITAIILIFFSRRHFI